MKALLNDLRATLRSAINEWKARRLLRRAGATWLDDEPAPF